MKNFDFIICGNNVGAMVAAIELAKKNNVAVINPTPNWGAHFAGIKLSEYKFDIGMNFFEFDSFHKEAADLLTYNPEIRNDSARFLPLVKEFFTKRIEVAESHNLKTLVNGTFGDDIIIANNFDVLNKLPVDIKSKIINELTAILAAPKTELHASNKKINEDLFLRTNYKKVSVANHGQTFHDLFIEPLCNKIFNISSEEVPAIYHRIPWTPLFYPETLLRAFKDPAYKIKPTLFHYPKTNYFASALETLLLEMKSNNNIEFINSKITELKPEGDKYIVETAEEKLSGSKIVWANDLQSLLSYNKSLQPITLDKASITVAFLAIKSEFIKTQFSTLYVAAGEELVYRVSNQNVCAGLSEKITKISIELNFDKLNEKGITEDQKIKDYIWNFLISSGCLQTAAEAIFFEVKSIKNAVNLPTLNNFNNFIKNQQLTAQHFGNVELVGPASGFGSTSFNCQVVQGLKLGVKYNKL